MKKIRVDRKNNKAFILTSEVELDGDWESYDQIRCDFKETKNLVCSDIYERLEINIYETEDIEIPYLDRVWVARDDGQQEILLTVYITTPDYSWHHDIAMNAVIRELRPILLKESSENTYEIGGEENTFWVSIYLPLDNKNLYSAIRLFLIDVRSKLSSVEEKINGFQWKADYQKNEEFFTQDLLIPLFRKMGYNHVRYNHGQREFGKDILLAETTKLYNTRNISVQVKAGNVSGKANTLIDTLISQIRDSFDMPVEGLGLAKQFRISEVYVVISGNYSENAREKINAKLPPSLSASVYFLDKEDIEWLTQKNWPLK